MVAELEELILVNGPEEGEDNDPPESEDYGADSYP